MVSLKFKVSDKELGKLIDAKMDEIADQIFADSQQNIITKNIVDEGTLLNSGIINRSFLDKEIAYNVPYADVIEFGRNPGTMPSVEPIVQWVLRKGIVKTEKEARRVAWAIAQDIKKNGQLPRPFLAPAVEKARITFK